MLAQYRELAAFAQFASDLDELTRKQLERGQRVTEIMKQQQCRPLSVAEMAVSLFAAEAGYLDELPLNKVAEFEDALLTFVRTNYKELLNTINAAGSYDDSIKTSIKTAIDIYCSTV